VSSDPKLRTISIQLQDSPIDNYIVLPDNMKELQYSNVLLGAIKGALHAVVAHEQVNINVHCEFVMDKLQGDPSYEIRVVLRPRDDADMNDYQE